MITITKSRFARRSLVLCGLAGAAVIWLMLSLVNLQLVSPRKTSGVSSGGIIEREVLLPQRGRIMDANDVRRTLPENFSHNSQIGRAHV